MRTLSEVPTTYSCVQIYLWIRNTSLYSCVPMVSSIERIHCVVLYVHGMTSVHSIDLTCMAQYSMKYNMLRVFTADRWCSLNWYTEHSKTCWYCRYMRHALTCVVHSWCMLCCHLFKAPWHQVGHDRRQSFISPNPNIQVVRLYIALMALATLLVAVCSLTTKNSNRYQVRPYPIVTR